jgi:hypothetical protein
MKTLLPFLLIIFLNTVIAQKEIDVKDAKNHIGETVKICTKIYGGRFFPRDTLTLLNAGDYYPASPLTLVIRADARHEFKEPETYYKGKNVCVTGQVDLFKGRPEIIISHKDQIIE